MDSLICLCFTQDTHFGWIMDDTWPPILRPQFSYWYRVLHCTSPIWCANSRHNDSIYRFKAQVT